jgi:hypothetical protein
MRQKFYVSLLVFDTIHFNPPFPPPRGSINDVSVSGTRSKILPALYSSLSEIYSWSVARSVYIGILFPEQQNSNNKRDKQKHDPRIQNIHFRKDNRPFHFTCWTLPNYTLKNGESLATIEKKEREIYIPKNGFDGGANDKCHTM